MALVADDPRTSKNAVLKAVCHEMDALRDDVPSDAENALGVTAFMLAAGHGYKDIVRCLAAEDSYGTSGAHGAL